MNEYKNKKDIFQMLRGGCCICIALNHCTLFNQFCFGECGVDFFLVLSGFLTALNASTRTHLRKTYLIDKIKKILPLYWIATLLIFAVGSIYPQLFSQLDFNTTNLMLSLFVIPGHTLYLFPGWTLAFFFEFYLVYYLADKYTTNRDLYASILIVAIVFIGIIINTIVGENVITKYFNPILLEFMYGIILFHILKKITIPQKLTWLSFVTSIILFFDYKEYLWPRYIVPAVLVCIAIAGFYSNDIDINKKRNILSIIGDISFVVYILHPIIIRPIDKILIRLTGSCFSPIYIIGTVVNVVVCVGICYILTPLLKKCRLA